MKFQVHPKVIKSYSTERIYVEFSEEPTDSVAIKIQPMEQYGIPHTAKFRIDEEDRYPYVEMKKETGRQSSYQQEWQRIVESEGYKYVVCRSVEQFRSILTEYLALPR